MTYGSRIPAYAAKMFMAVVLPAVLAGTLAAPAQADRAGDRIYAARQATTGVHPDDRPYARGPRAASSAGAAASLHPDDRAYPRYSAVGKSRVATEGRESGTSLTSGNSFPLSAALAFAVLIGALGMSAAALRYREARTRGA